MAQKILDRSEKLKVLEIYVLKQPRVKREAERSRNLCPRIASSEARGIASGRYFTLISFDRSEKLSFNDFFLSDLQCDCMEETGYFRAHWTAKLRKNRNRVISDNRKCSGNGQKLESWTDWMSSSEPKGVQVKILSHFGILEQLGKIENF